MKQVRCLVLDEMIRLVKILQRVNRAELLRHNALKEVLTIAVPNEVTAYNVLDVLPQLAIEVESAEGKLLVSHAKDKEEASWTIGCCWIDFKRCKPVFAALRFWLEAVKAESRFTEIARVGAIKGTNAE